MSRRLKLMLAPLLALACQPDASLNPATNEAPLAVIEAPGQASEGSSLTFDGRRSRDAEHGKLTYRWEFGDGSTATGPQPSHMYVDEGVYAVQLIVEDSQGARDTAEQRVTVVNVAPSVTQLAVPNDALPFGANATIQ